MKVNNNTTYLITINMMELLLTNLVNSILRIKGNKTEALKKKEKNFTLQEQKKIFFFYVKIKRKCWPEMC